jgi:hypothetical protein
MENFQCICEQAILLWPEVDASQTADRRLGEVALKSLGTACTRRKACRNRPASRPSACWLFEFLFRTEETVAAKPVELFHVGERGSIPQRQPVRARVLPPCRTSRTCKSVYRLITGLSKLSAEKECENFYKFSAAIYRLTAVSTG